MKIKTQLVLFLIIVGMCKSYSQETILNLKDAVDLAIAKSNEATLSNIKIDTKKLEYEVVKNNQYPDFKITGQYLRLAGANVDLATSGNNNGSGPDVNQLLIGQANINFPIFAGFKIKNAVGASQNLYEAEKLKALQTKEEIALKVVEYYANLYRAQKSVKLIQESLKTAEQRSKDFSDLEKNGIIARNDLLKSQLQQSKIQLSLDEMIKNVSTLNFYLITLMKLPEDYKIGIDEHQFDNSTAEKKIQTFENALQNRNDLKVFSFLEKAGENNIKIAKSGYFPQLALKGGYAALQLQNLVTVTNAFSFGLGFSYDLSSVFKINKDIKLAKSKLSETKINHEILTENIKIQNQAALENYNLTLKQNLVYEEAVAQATENYRIVKDKNDNGLATTTELLEADTESLNSKLNYALSRANSFLKYYEMQSAAGNLISSFK